MAGQTFLGVFCFGIQHLTSFCSIPPSTHQPEMVQGKDVKLTLEESSYNLIILTKQLPQSCVTAASCWPTSIGRALGLIF